jgi:peptidoglycan hydrolase-like protein with peptidoglycan-binding domain
MTFDCTKINLKKGSKGKQVEELQKILKEKKYYTRQVDGIYGKYTLEAVKKLQKAQGNSADGWFGPKTCKKLQQTKQEETEKTDTHKETHKKTPLITRLEKATKTTITDHKTLYKAFKNIKYKLYYNDIYTTEQEITRIEKGLPLNCTDSAQIAMQALLDLEYNKNHIRIVRGVVICKSDKAFGHVWLQLYIDGKWVNYDPSAMSCHGYPMGKLICNKDHKITNINPAWAVTDDGKT